MTPTPAPTAAAGTAAQLDRARGCMIGQVIGDSLGSLVEFKSARAIAALYPGGVRDLADGGVWNTLAGQPTDDSELALALARNLVARKGYDIEHVAEAYGRWYGSEPFDIGNTTRRALSAAFRSPSDKAAAARAAADPDSQANGSLMRIAPIGIWARDPDAAAQQAALDSELTHPHPVCKAACASFVAAIASGVRHGDRQGMLDAAAAVLAEGGSSAGVAPLRDALSAARDGIAPRDVDGAHQGWVLIAYQNAFCHLARGASVEDGLVETVGRGGDTDTNAAIAGALLGALHGAGSIPRRWIDAIAACRPGATKRAARPRPAEYWPADIMQLAADLHAAGRG